MNQTGFQADLSGKLTDTEGERMPARFQTRPGNEATLLDYTWWAI